MKAANLISRALSEQVRLEVHGDQLHLVFDNPPAPDLVSALKENKQQVLDEIRRLQQQWLERVARMLYRPVDWILEHRIIEECDIREGWHTEPREAAKTAKTYLRWHLANH